MPSSYIFIKYMVWEHLVFKCVFRQKILVIGYQTTTNIYLNIFTQLQSAEQEALFQTQKQ